MTGPSWATMSPALRPRHWMEGLTCGGCFRSRPTVPPGHLRSSADWQSAVSPVGNRPRVHDNCGNFVNAPVRSSGLNYPFPFLMTNGIVDAMKTETIQIDKAGRVVLPKPLREQFHLLPGDKLRLSVERNGFRLEPTEAGGELVRKGSVLVFTGG